ncbi:MAG: nucleoside deaminase [Hyphomonadaceae bacterium]|nr:nucleoside deaminase [Hyphomonadaceae bacterium]
MMQGNVSAVEHAEAVLAREAAKRFAPEYLWQCTLVTTVEPCAMCAGTQYWAHIGRLVYGLSERDLLALTGNHAENPTLDLPCREVVTNCVIDECFGHFGAPFVVVMEQVGACDHLLR